MGLGPEIEAADLGQAATEIALGPESYPITSGNEPR